MAEYEIDSAVASDLTNVKTDITVETKTTDGVSEQKETTWMNTQWTQQLGYYDAIPELNAVIDANAFWTVGKGYKADEPTEMLLDTIKGNGFDTFNSIMNNGQRTLDIGGNFYAHIVRDDEDNLINLKPLPPDVMRHVADSQGMIIRFEQTAKLPKDSKEEPKTIKKFDPEEIFYLPRNRVADEIHGQSMVTPLQWIIDAKNEAMKDQRTTFHRFVVPRWIIKLDTSKPTKVAAEKAKWDKANEGGENMYTPMGSVEVEQMAISPNSTLNPSTWMEWLDDQFYKAAKTPKIVVGGTGGFTEASVNIAYLSFQQNIEAKQLFWEEQILNQLNLVIELEFPADLMGSVLSDRKKDGQPTAIKPDEITPTVKQ